jgi:hypothetical protein
MASPCTRAWRSRLLTNAAARRCENAGLYQVGFVLAGARHRLAVQRAAHVRRVGWREGRAHDQVLDVDPSAGADGCRKARCQAGPRGDVMDGKPADGRVEARVRQRVGQRIATHVGDAVIQSAPACERGRDVMHLLLQFQRRDMAPHRVREVPGRAAEPGSHVEHAAVAAEADDAGTGAHGVGAQVVELVKSKELVGRQRVVGTDTDLCELVVNAMDVHVQRHRGDAPAAVNRLERHR